MVFSNFTRSEANNNIFFKSVTPIKLVKTLKYYKDNASGVFNKKEFRWSFDQSYWSSWEKLDQGNITSISIVNKPTLFLEVRYSKGAVKSNVTVFSVGYTAVTNAPAPVKKPVAPLPKPVPKPAPKPVIKSGSSSANYSNFSRSEANSQILFSSINPLKLVKTIKYYKDNAIGVFTKREFRWSFNRSYWASWETLNQGNMSSIETAGNPLLYLEIRYTKGAVRSNVTSFSLNYSTLSSGDVQTAACDIKKNTKPVITPPKTVYVETPIRSITKDTIIDAGTLNGKSGDFYLWRPNHKGSQPISSVTDLQKILNDLQNTVNGATIQGALNVEGNGIGVYYNTADKQLYFKTIIQGNKVFVSENDKGNITIDMDDASINDLYELVGNIEGVNIGSPGSGNYGEVYKQKTDENLEFRTIVGGNSNVKVTTTDNQVRISLDGSAYGAPIWTDPDPVSADVGGINNGDNIPLASDSIEILEKMLYEYIPPEITILTPTSRYYEKYVDNSDINVYGEFDNSKSVKTNVISAELLINGSGSISYPPIIYPPDTTYGTFSWDVAGPPLYDDRVYTIRINNSFGSNTNIMPPVDSSFSIKYVNPYFSGIVGDVITVDNITASDIINLDKLIEPKQANTISYDVSANFVKIKFAYAYDDSYGDVKLIHDIKNNFNVSQSFEHGTKLISNGSGNNIPYKVYVKNHWISFTPDVSIFKLVFDI